ncbi:MAG: tripartite tricarboxylate transporter substrate binding protein [Paucibacter sp.]|nr:tripartite tricarboxylate transporter substrate binding protein [Roseateles sp.]
MNRRSLLAATASTALPAWAQQAGGQGIRLVVPFSPGGVIDALARPLADHVQERLGPLYVDNIAGLRGSTGAAFVAKAQPDGNTLLISSVVTQAINPWIGAASLYDPVRDFTPISLLARITNVLVVNRETARRARITSVAALVEYALNHPGRLTYASPGIGTTSHLAAEMFKERTRTQINHQPYAGVNAVSKALLSGEVDIGFQNLSSSAADIRSGRLKALAVSGLSRSIDLPDVPTLNESPSNLRLAGFDVGIWIGLFGPARMARDQVMRINAAFGDALNSPVLREKLRALKAEPSPSTPEQLAALVRTDLARYQPLAKRERAQLE